MKTNGEEILQITNLHTHYGSLHVLKGISLTVQQGEIVTLIGANGAGKSTLLRTISGLLHPTSGEITFHGIPVHRQAAHKIARMQLLQVPEGRHIFSRLTVLENLEMGAITLKGGDEQRKRLGRVFRHFPILSERQSQQGGTLSGGEQQMLAMGRALMANPKLLLLDEPSLGLAPKLVTEIFQIIHEIQQEGVTILLVEQNAHLALQVSQRGYVLETGRIVLEGKSQELANNPQVRDAYLGG